MAYAPESITPQATETLALADFWSIPEASREDLLLGGILAAHCRHYALNTAYRNTVAARGVGPRAQTDELPRLLRATSQAFKSYIDILGTPFPQDRPAEFVDWLADQLSVDLRAERRRFRSRYRSLEALLSAIERAFADLGLEMLTSSGTSGRATIIARDKVSTNLTVESFHLAFQRYLGMKADHTAIFMMPKRTRIAMARMAAFSVRRVGLDPRRVHFTIPFAAYPDHVRVRTGRTFRRGWRGLIEKRVWHPMMTLLHETLVDARAVESAISHLIPAAAHGERVLLFGSPAQLHKVARFLLESGRTMTLAPESLLGTGGGMKDAYPHGQEEIRQDLQTAFRLPTGEPVPVRDVYGMAEANWAAMQCGHGNYHVPPWVYAVTLGDSESFQLGARTTGLLAFFDPYGGGDLFPAFFRSADRVTLVRGARSPCPCGEQGDYLEKGSIQRIDRLGEAGCAGQV
jgi:hypothetical protein